MNGQRNPRLWVLLDGCDQTHYHEFPHPRGKLVIVTQGRRVVIACILDSERRLQPADGEYIPVWYDNREGEKAA